MRYFELGAMTVFNRHIGRLMLFVRSSKQGGPSIHSALITSGS